MSAFFSRARVRRLPLLSALLSLAAAVLVGACQSEVNSAAPEIRPVCGVTVERREAGTRVTLTGRIEAEDGATLGFRIADRVFQNDRKLGDQVQPHEIVARLESQNELNALRSAAANLAAARGQLVQARNHFERQDTLMARGFTTRPQFDQAKQALQTALSRVDDAEAQLNAAHDLVGFTELKADAAGVVTATGPGAGAVVHPQIVVGLTNDPTVPANGHVREVAPQADPVTRTFEVKVGLTDPPEAMRLRTTVTGHLQMEATSVIEIPATALVSFDRQPAVWIVDPSSSTVSIRNIDVLRLDQAHIAVSQGIDAGDIVVTAGVQALHPGQKVSLLGSEP
jgi:multidrug efflux pump subunit AcrA (membrane-fusion protein)